MKEHQEPWTQLWGAQPFLDGRPVGERHTLNCLEQLRLRIGQDAYYHGRMPPILPAWTLEERD